MNKELELELVELEPEETDQQKLDKVAHQWQILNQKCDSVLERIRKRKANK